MHKKKYNSMELEITLTPRSPLLIKSGGISPNPSLPDMQFVRTSVNGIETIYIPGSSLKGIFRSYAEKIIRTKKGENEEGSCDITGENSCPKRLDQMEKKENRSLSSHEIYRYSCKTCKIFGNTKLKSRIYFLDAYPKNQVKTETRYGVAISRLTHAVAQGPFEMEVVVSGNFKSKIYLGNFEVWQLGLLALMLKGLNSGLVGIGFGKNRGFGEVEVEVNYASFMFSEEIPKDEIWGVGKFADDAEREGYGFKQNDLIKIEVLPTEVDELLFVRRSYNGKGWDAIASEAISHLRDLL